MGQPDPSEQRWPAAWGRGEATGQGSRVPIPAHFLQWRLETGSTAGPGAPVAETGGVPGGRTPLWGGGGGFGGAAWVREPHPPGAGIAEKMPQPGQCTRASGSGRREQDGEAAQGPRGPDGGRWDSRRLTGHLQAGAGGGIPTAPSSPAPFAPGPGRQACVGGFGTRPRRWRKSRFLPSCPWSLPALPVMWNLILRRFNFKAFFVFLVKVCCFAKTGKRFLI